MLSALLALTLQIAAVAPPPGSDVPPPGALPPSALGLTPPSEPATAVEGVVVEGRRKSAPPPLNDAEIERQFDALREAEPDRVVCLAKRVTGGRIPQNFCGTLAQWYGYEAERQTLLDQALGQDRPGGRRTGPPRELVELVKDRLRAPKTRSKAEARAAERRATAKGG